MRTAVKVMATAAVSAGVGIAVVVGNAGAGSDSVEAGSVPVEENINALAGQLRCPEGDLILTRILEVDTSNKEQAAQRAATPEDAVGRVLSRYEKLDESQFKRTSSDEKHALLEYTKGDKKRFITSVRKFDEGWAVNGFVACNSTLVEAQARPG